MALGGFYCEDFGQVHTGQQSKSRKKLRNVCFQQRDRPPAGSSDTWDKQVQAEDGSTGAEETTRQTFLGYTTSQNHVKPSIRFRESTDLSFSHETFSQK